MKTTGFSKLCTLLLSATVMLATPLAAYATQSNPTQQVIPVTASLDSYYMVAVPSAINLTREYNDKLVTTGDNNATYYGICGINISGNTQRDITASITCSNMSLSGVENVATSYPVGLCDAGADQTNLEAVFTGTGEKKEFAASDWTEGAAVDLVYTDTEINESADTGATKDVLLRTTLEKDGTYSGNLTVSFGMGALNPVGKTFNMGSYKWLVVKKIEGNNYALQVCGVADGETKISSCGVYPSYKANDYQETENDVVFTNIASTQYVDEEAAADLLSTYEIAKLCESSGGFDADGIWSSSNVQNGFYLLPYDMIVPFGIIENPDPVGESDINYGYFKGLWNSAKEAFDGKFGKFTENSYSEVFLGTAEMDDEFGFPVGTSVDYIGWVSSGRTQFIYEAIAPAFNLDMSKVTISGNNIIVN